MRWLICSCCIILSLTSTVIGYQEIRKGLYSFMKDTRPVAEATLYIPLGHHAKIKCPFDQYDGLKDMKVCFLPKENISLC
ncbi:hypothetical protein OESDEN_20377 [Oesophagostomum dentatum]|uniref:Uncharacterized protein n=1 Tax=Oesophagostomum dentatum TaxID=61180 RepID=A0A0B1S3M0_OESDE|nr:hypothetical protein OESDEN_20377 [Oesophagostomum dentatum]